MSETISISNKCCAFKLFIPQMFIKLQIYKTAQLFSTMMIIRNLSQAFLKDHVTLKNGVMAAFFINI